MAFGEILNSLFSVFFLLAPGFLFKKFNLITDQHIDGLTTILMYIVWPAVLFNSLQVPFSSDMFLSSQKALLLMIVVYSSGCAIAYLLAKLFRAKKQTAALFCVVCILSNTGAMGLPIISSLYGNDALFFASMVEIINNVTIFTLGVKMIKSSMGSTEKTSFKSFFSPPIIAIIIGYIFFVLNFQLPTVLQSTISKVADASPALSMFIVGYLLGKVNPVEFVNDKRIYYVAGFKLLIFPIITFLICFFILKDTSLLAKTVTIQTAMPAANTTAVLAQKYKGDVSFVTRSILVSTMISILTISIWALVLEAIMV